jgi:hypothetical protein
MPLSLYTAHVTFVGLTEADDPLPYYLVQVGIALLVATVWRRYVGAAHSKQCWPPSPDLCAQPAHRVGT